MQRDHAGRTPATPERIFPGLRVRAGLAPSFAVTSLSLEKILKKY